MPTPNMIEQPENTPGDKEGNLPKAYALLRRYMNSRNFRSFDKKSQEPQLVLNLLNQLQTLFAQRGWLHQGGVAANYYAKTLNPSPPTQQELTEEAIETDYKTREFTKKILEKAKHDILHRKKGPPKPYHLLNLLNEILPLIDNTLNQTKLQTTIAHSIISDPLVILAQELNARFHASDQGRDPLNDTEGGHCYGHVMMWRDNVTKNARPLYQIYRETPASYREQNHQISKHSIKKMIFNKDKTIRSALQEIIPLVSTDNVYELSYHSFDHDNKQIAHSMGIRHLPDDSYEFFDPNKGIFVFENAFQLEKWLTHFMHNDTLGSMLDKKSLLELRLIGKQPVKAVASIPSLAPSPPPKKKVLSYLTNLKSNVSPQRIAYFNHSAELLSVTKKIDPSSAKSDQEYIYLYFKPNGTFESSRIDDESKSLKDSVVKKIDSEIERIENKLLGDKNEKTERITALNDLKEKINNAELTQTLSTVINQWLESKSISHSDTTNRERISSNDTRLFINRLEEKNEISPYFLNLMRASVIEQLRHMIIEQDWTNLATDSKTINLLRDALTNFSVGDTGIRDFLLQIKGITSNSYTSNPLYNIAHGGKSNLNELYHQLSQIQPDDGHSLKYQLEKLQAFNSRFLKKINAPQPEKPTTHPRL